jgi:hypothetical protein
LTGSTGSTPFVISSHLPLFFLYFALLRPADLVSPRKAPVRYPAFMTWRDANARFRDTREALFDCALGSAHGA